MKVKHEAMNLGYALLEKKDYCYENHWGDPIKTIYKAVAFGLLPIDKKQEEV